MHNRGCTGKEDHPRHDARPAVERIGAALEAARALRFSFMLTGRAQNLLYASPHLEEAISRPLGLRRASRCALRSRPSLTLQQCAGSVGRLQAGQFHGGDLRKVIFCRRTCCGPKSDALASPPHSIALRSRDCRTAHPARPSCSRRCAVTWTSAWCTSRTFPGRHARGTGTMDNAAIYRELRKQGYRGWVAMEFCPSEMPVQNSAGQRRRYPEPAESPWVVTSQEA
jgi:hypothetical protein